MSGPVLDGVDVAVDARYLGRPGMGINRYLEAAVALLREAGAELTLLVDQTTVLPASYEDLPRVRLENRSPRGWEQVSVARYLWAHPEHGVYFAPGNTGIPLVLSKRGRRLVLCVHDLIPLHLPLRYGRRPLGYLGYCCSLLVSLRRADAVLANSSATAGEVRRIFRRSAATSSLPLARMLGLDRDGAGSRPSPEGRTGPGGRAARAGRYFVYNGGADARKNVGALLLGFAAFAREASGFELVVLGNGYATYEALARRLGIEGVTFLGYVCEEEKRALVEGAVGLVYPSSMEGYGLPVVEGLLGRTVVLCADRPVLREVGGDAPVLLDSLDPPGIADGLARVAGLGPAERSRRIEEGTAQARRQLEAFDEARFLEAFRESLPSRAAGR